jgi:polyisoprenyl-teichoic acid--peptidoglycan teichoic acid transferase
MNLRKFYLMVSSVLLVFLFVLGLLFLNQINYKKTTGYDSTSPKNDIFESFVDYKPMNILLLGGDYVNKNTDTIMVLNYNPMTSKISLLSLPRDTKVQIEGRSRKINYAYPHGGIDLINSTIKDLLGIDINYYIYIDTSVFRKIIDILGGVDYNIPIDLNYDDDVQNLHIHLKEGQQTLDGSQAEQFMRFRHPSSWKRSPGIKKFYNGSDLNRIDAQQNFIKEVIKQKFNIIYIPKFKNVITTLFQEVKTNFEMNNAIRIIQKATEIKSTDISYFKLSGEDKYINSASYFVYNDKIQNNSTNEAIDAAQILNEYFRSSDEFVENMNNNNDNSNKIDTQNESSKASTTKNTKSVRKNNPSNSQGTIKAKRTPAP